jgi:hypothetical protein
LVHFLGFGITYQTNLATLQPSPATAAPLFKMDRLNRKITIQPVNPGMAF